MRPFATPLVALCCAALASSLYGLPAAASAPKTTPSKAPENATTLDAELRFRGSAARHLVNLQAGQGDLLRGVFQRIRAGIAYKRPELDAYVQMQTAGALGAPVKFDPDGSRGTIPVPVGLQQGWIRWRPAELPGLRLQIGRMALEYGAGRRIGRYDFHESGNAFDGVRVGYELKDVLQFDVLAVKLRRNTAQPESERNLMGTYVVAKPTDSVRTDVYFLYLADGDEDLRANHMNMGLRLVLKPVPWLLWDIEAAVQFGDLRPKGYLTPIDHVATSLTTELHLSTVIAVPLGLVLRFQRHSGDPDAADDVSEAWRPLYPSLAKHIGLLQLFPQSNMLQYGAGLRVGATDKKHLLLDVRFCRAMSKSVVPAFNQPTLISQDTWAPLGTEVDVQVVVPFLDRAKLLLVTAVFAPSSLLGEAVGERWAQLFMVQVSASF